MMPNPLAACFDSAPGHCFGLHLCGACPEKWEGRSVFYKNPIATITLRTAPPTMRSTAVLISLAIGGATASIAALRSYPRHSLCSPT